jgi:hypothetical protein
VGGSRAHARALLYLQCSRAPRARSSPM